MNVFQRLWNYLFGKRELGSVTSQVDDSAGWAAISRRQHDYEQTKIQEIYSDALEAWRKNPIAWRIISITTDYVVGDRLKVTSTRRDLQKFIDQFWNHPKNVMDMRLEGMCDELSRAGDLFVLLFRNSADGMSYIRFLTKDQIVKIETASNDWENELEYHELQELSEPRIWYSPSAPQAENSEAICLHYSVNKPIGALLGESDLQTMLPWLQRYSRMLEDRVRLHWALRAFLWIVNVPTNRVEAKKEQYKSPPEAGSIIVKDESEVWEAVTPRVQGQDAKPDLAAVRQMIDAGSGYPPHWRGEAADANLATATAMQGPTERHLLRRQKYFIYMLQDILYHAYQRGAQVGRGRMLTSEDYGKLFAVTAPDISRSDNESLSRAGRDLAEAYRTIASDLIDKDKPTMSRQILRSFFKFIGEPQGEEMIEQVIKEAGLKDGTEPGN